MYSLSAFFNFILPLIAVAVLALFLWGVFLFFTRRGDESARTRGRRHMRFGAVGLFAVVFFWGVIGYSQQSMGLSGVVTPGGIPSTPSVGMAPSDDYAAPFVYREEAGFRAAEKNMNYTGAIAPESVIAPIPPIPGGDAPAGEAKIIRTGSLSIVVKDVYRSAAEIRAIRVALGGQPGMESFNEYTKGSLSGNMTIWVPSEKFDEAMARIEALAVRVNNRTVNTEDVSSQFVDLEARLKNLRAAEIQIAEILKRSGKITEVLEVTRELTRTRGEIEHIQGQLNYLARRVALSSITVGLTQEVNPVEVRDEWEPLLIMKTATKNMLRELTRIADRTIEFFVWLPVILLNLLYWIAILFIVWKIGRFGYRKFRAAWPDLTNKL